MMLPDYFLEEGYERACWYMDNVDQHDFEKKYRPSFFSEAIDTYRQKRSRKPCSLNEIFTIEYPKRLYMQKCNRLLMESILSVPKEKTTA